MTSEQLAALRAAVDALNAVMDDIRKTCDQSVRIRPYGNYDISTGYARVSIEVTTGRHVLGDEA